MQPNIFSMHVRLRIVCMTLALMMVTPVLRATDYYLVGDFNKWTPATLTSSRSTKQEQQPRSRSRGADKPGLYQVPHPGCRELIKFLVSQEQHRYDGNRQRRRCHGPIIEQQKDADYTVSGLSTLSSTTYTLHAYSQL